MENPLLPTPRTTLTRHPERASSDLAAFHALIDEAWICHVAVIIDGLPVVLPTMHARVGDSLYLHGARQNRQFLALLDQTGSVSFTALDGLVYAERAFSHSMNYRSALLFAQGREVTDDAEKQTALHALVERFGRGRAQEAIAPSEAELRATLVVALPITVGSFKTRSGAARESAPRDAPDVWTGVVPMGFRADCPQGSPTNAGSAISMAAVRTALVARETYAVTRGDVLVSTDPQRLDLDFVQRFLRDESYWAHGLTRASFLAALPGSLQFGLYRAASQIGYARVVHDGARFAYLADVFIAEHARTEGLGIWLVQQVLAHPVVARVKRVLLGTRDAHGLYARFGFRPVPDGRFMARDLPDSCA
jgi:nitroimidazol reductase NimA-like FMN-containing flavoprotein (pyridoxamine 5'-phosphate oxidase superfamily)/GNAT superfamily N-acetyltransferase